MRVSDAGWTRRTSFQIEGGPRFFGSLGMSQAADLQDARHLLLVRPGALVKTGDVIRTPDGGHFLVADHAHGYQGGVLYRQYKLFAMTDHVLWQRSIPVSDPVTGLSRGNAYASLGYIWVSYEPLPDLVDMLQVPVDQATVITGSNLVEGDRVGGLIVRDTARRLGIMVAIVR